MSQTAFVTGGTGFVGMNLVKQLVERGWEVTALVRQNSPVDRIEGLDVRLHLGDITDPDSLRSGIPKDVDAVFHVAASTNIWSPKNPLQTRINVDGTHNVLDAAIKAGAGRLIHTSSFIVWGFHETLLNENSRWLENASWINYVRSKQAAETLVKQAVTERRVDAVIMNPAHILGPGDTRNWSRVIRLVHENDLPGIPPGGGAFADVREVASAHIQAFHVGRKGENYLLGGHDTMFIDVVRMTGEILGRKVPERPTPAWLLKMIAQVYVLAATITGTEPDLTPEGAAMITRHIKCDSSKAVAELGYRFTAVRQLLIDTSQWLRDKGMLN